MLHVLGTGPVVLTLIAVAATTCFAENPPAAAIVNRYGGQQKLAGSDIIFKEGRRCNLGIQCQEFRTYRNGESRLRVEESFAPPLWRITIVRGTQGHAYYHGPWWKRAWFWAGGVRDEPIADWEVSAASLDFQQELFTFVRNLDSPDVVYEGQTPTRDGVPADTFAQKLSGGRYTVRFYFDPQSHLSVQRTITKQNAKPSSYVIYRDYREVNGLPYPFTAELWGDGGASKTRDEVLSSVQVGLTLNDELFTAIPNDPLWLFPAKVLGLLALLAAATWAWRSRSAA